MTPSEPVNSRANPVPLSDLEFFQPGWVEPSTTVASAAERFLTDVPPVAVPQPRHAAVLPPDLAPTIAEPLQQLFSDADLDWATVTELRLEASGRLTEAQSERPDLEDAEQRSEGERIVADVVSSWVNRRLQSGHQTSPDVEQRMNKAVMDALFGLGRIQGLVETGVVKNIEIKGAEQVFLELVDGTVIQGPPVVDSDFELRTMVSFWAQRSKTPRPFGPGNPELNLTLEDGSRLAAMIDRTLQTIVTIRVHTMINAELDDLVAKETITPLVQNFLEAAMKSECSVVFAGGQGAGKTTLARACCGAITYGERIITIESDRELHLDRLPDKFPRTIGIEAAPGTGEFRPDGREAGSYGIVQAIKAALRHNGDRLIVGEVRHGDELLAMLQAMQSCLGSISTTHAHSARGTYDKLVTLCTEAGVTETFAQRQVATVIDFIVYVAKVNVASGHGRRYEHRVREIVGIARSDDNPAGVEFTTVFSLDTNNQLVPHTLPPKLDQLQDAGFDSGEFIRQSRDIA